MRFPITRAMPLAVALAIAAVSAASTAAEGQARPTRNLIINYMPGGPSQNGYMDAQQAVTYWFQECAEGVGFVAKYSPTVHMVVYPHRYWVGGRQVQVPSQFSAPPAPKPTLKGTIRGNGIAREVTYRYASHDPSCWTNGIILGPKSQFWAAKATDAEKARVLADFGFDLQANLPALRNSDVENHFLNLFAAERRDSAQKVAAARADSLQRSRRADSVTRARVAQARRDSIQRADATRREAAATGSASSRPSSAAARADSVARADAARRAAAASAGAGALTSTGTATSSSTTSGAAQRQRNSEVAAQKEREAAANAAAQRQRDADHARAVEAERQRLEVERQRLQAERQQQLEGAVQQTAVAALGIIESIAESRRVSAEKRRIREARARREADAAYAAYAAATKARFDAAPARPLCSPVDIRDSLVLSIRPQQRTLRITGDECRLAQGQSAILMTLVVNSAAAVVLTPTSSPLITNLHLLKEGSNAVTIARHEGPYTANLERGRYILVVSSRLPGEVGDVTLSARKGWVSDAQGSVGGAMAPQKRINGFVGDNQMSTAFMDLSLGLQHRPRFPYLVMGLLIGTDTYAQEGMFDLGLRQYIGPRNMRLSPWIEASVGYRNITVLEEPFTTISPAVGAGFNLRFSDGYGVALNATHIMGSARNSGEFFTSTPPAVPLNRTIMRLGLMIY